MSDYTNKTKITGEVSSLSDNPCISVCSLTYGISDTCICGRNVSQVTNWNAFDDATKKLIVINAIDNKDSFPRQKLSFLADEYGISVDAARKIFVLDRLED
tara:strand:+ start:1597 stop:1899 length:303 start_codon:yes stop_codon:yes gene_type:complete